MGRNDRFTIETFIEVEGKTIPLVTIDKDGNKTQHVSDEDLRKYNEAMMKNAGEVMSLYYSAHPDLLK